MTIQAFTLRCTDSTLYQVESAHTLIPIAMPGFDFRSTESNAQGVIAVEFDSSTEKTKSLLMIVTVRLLLLLLSTTVYKKIQTIVKIKKVVHNLCWHLDWD